MFLDPQCTVSQEDFQHKIPNWSTLLPLLSLHTSRAVKRGWKKMRIVYRFRSSRLEVLHKKYLFWRFWKAFTKTPEEGSCYNKIARPATILKYDPIATAFLGIFQNLYNSHSVIYKLVYICQDTCIFFQFISIYITENVTVALKCVL